MTMEPREAQLLATIDELMALPSTEAAMATFDDLGDEIRAALDDEFGAFARDVESGSGPGGAELEGSSGHSEYLVDGTRSQFNMVQIIMGKPERAVAGL